MRKPTMYFLMNNLIIYVHLFMLIYDKLCFLQKRHERLVLGGYRRYTRRRYY